MKFCENCGARLEDDEMFCGECGTKVETVVYNEQTETKEKKPTKSAPKKTKAKTQKPQNQITEKAKGKKSGLDIAFIIFVAVLILAIVGVAIYFLVIKNKTGSNSNEQPQVATNVTANTTNATNATNTTQPTANPSEYILPDSDKRLVTKEELQKLNPELLRLACNELYARHGRKFNDSSIQEHFNKCSWYRGTVEPDAFDENVFSEVEKQNKDLIVAYEKEIGSNQTSAAVAPNDVPDSGYRGEQLALAHDYPNFTGYTNDQLIRAAKYDMNSQNRYPEKIEIESVQGDKVLIALYTDMEERRHIFDYYTVNRRGYGTNNQGNDLDLWMYMDKIY
ncbi:MAG: YARHG domain-containing protein [Lachnospiraceae bacterium]|nr:YARHG domain-containing protein [Lachnospiraceae bacterium]